MHRPVCVKCEVELTCKENEVGCLDISDNREVQVWDSDLWACPVCGYELVTGFGRMPVDHDMNDTLARTIQNYRDRSRIVNNKR